MRHAMRLGLQPSVKTSASFTKASPLGERPK